MCHHYKNVFYWRSKISKNLTLLQLYPVSPIRNLLWSIVYSFHLNFRMHIQASWIVLSIKYACKVYFGKLGYNCAIKNNPRVQNSVQKWIKNICGSGQIVKMGVAFVRERVWQSLRERKWVKERDHSVCANI